MVNRVSWAILIFLISTPAMALEPDRREVNVIHARVWKGEGYKEIFIPSSKAEMTLVADVDNAISMVGTLEYYWPLSRQVYVDFEARRERLDGTLTITSAGETVAEIQEQQWAIHYPDGAIGGDAELLWGEAATEARARNMHEQSEFNRRMIEAKRAHREYERKLLEAGAARKDGEPAAEITPPPPLPEPDLSLVTEPKAGYRINLPPGEYEIKLSQDGETVPGTQKSLRVVDLPAEPRLVAEIIPEERWTRPIPANSASSRVYARPGSVIYVKLANALRVPEMNYLPVVSPQASPVDGRHLWIRRGEAQNRSLNISWHGFEDDHGIERQSFEIEQTHGTGFGYRIRPARQGEIPELEAFQVEIPRSTAVTRGNLTAPGGDGETFSREIVIVHPRNGTAGLLLAFLPVAAYLAARAGTAARRKSAPSGQS